MDQYLNSRTTNLENGNNTGELSHKLNMAIVPAVGARNISRAIILIHEVVPTDVHP